MRQGHHDGKKAISGNGCDVREVAPKTKRMMRYEVRRDGRKKKGEVRKLKKTR